MRKPVWMGMSYPEYLHTSWWLSRKAQAIRDAGYKCERCGSMIRLQVHHVSYANIGDESKEDLVVLCEKHHKALHGKE